MYLHKCKLKDRSPPAYKLMCLQTKPKEQIRGILHLSQLAESFVWVCTLKNLKKVPKKWENAYFTIKNAKASRTLRQPWPLANNGSLCSPNSTLLHL